MKNTQIIKVQTSLCKVAILYDDNSSEIKDILLVGKYTLSKAKKYFKENNNIANTKTVEVLAVETRQVLYEVDTIELNNWCNEHKLNESNE